MKAFIEQAPFVLKKHIGKAAFLDSDAADAEAALLATLESLPPGSLLPIEFGGIRIASAAARRLLKRAVLRLRAGELEDRYLILGDLHESEDNVEIMLRGEDLLAVERSNEEGPRLLGEPDIAVRQTYDFLLTVPYATAGALRDELSLASISAATNRLTNLARLALARRVDQRTVPGGGREFVYSAVR